MPINTTQQTTALPTFDTLCRTYPTLRMLADEAEQFQENDDPNFCANQAWYGHGRWQKSLRNRVVTIADKAVKRFGQQRVYDVVYDGVYDRLPDCRRCGCLSREDF